MRYCRVNPLRRQLFYFIFYYLFYYCKHLLFAGFYFEKLSYFTAAAHSGRGFAKPHPQMVIVQSYTLATGSYCVKTIVQAKPDKHNGEQTYLPGEQLEVALAIYFCLFVCLFIVRYSSPKGNYSVKGRCQGR